MSQSLPFVCGPAALIHALNSRGSSIANDLGNQIRVWRTANTIFMGQGLAGCDAGGLLIAAEQFGAALRWIRLQPDFSFDRTVRSRRHKQIIRLVENEHMEHALAAGRASFPVDAAQAAHLVDEALPVLLLLSMRAYSQSNEYHWIAFKKTPRGRDVYDPMAGQYEIGLRPGFFDHLRSMELCEFLKTYERHLIDILN